MNKLFLKVLTIFTVLLFTTNIYASIKYYQATNLNTDGSISLSITYSALKSEISKNNNIIGVFTFDQKALKEYFNFQGANITKSVAYTDPNDANRTAVTVEIRTKNIFKISDAKSLNDLKIAYLKKDSGMVFSWFIPENYIKSNSIDTYQYIVTSDFDILSTNGILKDKKISWFAFGNKPDPRGYFYVTTLKSDGDFVSSESENKTNNSSNNEKPAGCGLFGIEMPFLLLTGLILSRKFKKK